MITMGEIANIVIGADYFRKNARSDYASPLSFVWIREAIQNSVDANATRIDITVQNECIELSDNGHGMNLDTITNKLLTLGGTKKEEGSVGGFGKAKEILFFAWDKWEIETCATAGEGLFVSNEMISKEPIMEYKDKSLKVGTRIKISSGSIYDWEPMIASYIAYCTTDCEIFINGSRIKTMEHSGKARQYEWGKITINKQYNTSEVFVRVNGILMHKRYLNDFRGSVVVELIGDTTKILSGNRDSLTYQYRNDLDSIIAEINVNPKSAMKEQQQPQIDSYAGTSVVDEIKSLISSDEFTKLKKIFDGCTINGITNFQLLETKLSEEHPQLAGVISSFILNESDTVGPLGYAFIVKRNGRTKPNIKIESKRAQTILHYWTNIVLKLMYNNGLCEDIGVGLVFGEETIAELATIKGKNYFLINPNHVGSTNSTIPLGIELFMAAAHEVSHLYYVDHNEHFSSRLGAILKDLSSNWETWKDVFILSKREVLKAIN